MRILAALVIGTLALSPSRATAQPAWPQGVNPGQAWLPAQPTAPPQGAPVYPAPPGYDPDLARLDKLLRHRADNGRAFGIGTGIAGLAIGALCIPTGIYMINKNQDPNGTSDPVPGTIVAGLGISAATAGLFAFFLSSGDLDTIGRGLEDREEQHEPPPQIVAEVEAEWAGKAASAHTGRRTLGIVSIVGGILVLGVGTGLAIADPIGDLSRSEQQTLGGLMMAGGGVTVLGGFGSIFLETEVESTWHTYESFKGAPGVPAPMAVAMPSFGIVPLRGGAMVSSGIRF